MPNKESEKIFDTSSSGASHDFTNMDEQVNKDTKYISANSILEFKRARNNMINQSEIRYSSFINQYVDSPQKLLLMQNPNPLMKSPQVRLKNARNSFNKLENNAFMLNELKQPSKYLGNIYGSFKNSFTSIQSPNRNLNNP